MLEEFLFETNLNTICKKAKHTELEERKYNPVEMKEAAKERRNG